MKIVIFGLAKSGTTALFYKIKNSLPANTVCLFEPQSFDAGALRESRFRWLTRGKRKPDVLAKVLPFRPHHSVDVESFSHFEKQILIVRDPRDRFISRLLYGIYDSEIVRDELKVRALVSRLEQKETDPRSVSMKTLLQLFTTPNAQGFSFSEWASAHVCHSIRRPLEFHQAREHLFAFKYEDLVDGHFEKLEEYLGRPLPGEARVAAEFNRVTRTRSYGGWRDWFTLEDVDFLRPIMQPFLDCHYPSADWTLNAVPSISSEHGSRYVLRITNERRTLLRLPTIQI